MVNDRLYPAEVREVYSADDLFLQIDLEIAGVHIFKRARLHGVDTPDAFKKSPNSKEGRLRDEVRGIIRGKCKVSIVKEVKGDLIVNLFYATEDGMVSLNQQLIERGYVFSHPER